MFDPREVGFDRLEFRFGDPKSKDYNLILNSGYDITPDWQLYAFGTYGHRNATSAANWRQYNNTTANRDYSVLLPSTTPSNTNFVPLTSMGFLPLIGTHLRDYSATLGVRGDVAGWKVDLSAGRGHNKFDYQVHDTLNASFGPNSQQRLRCRRASLCAEHLQPRRVARLFGRLLQAADGGCRCRIPP